MRKQIEIMLQLSKDRFIIKKIKSENPKSKLLLKCGSDKNEY